MIKKLLLLFVCMAALLQGRESPPCVVVIFGATGDLTARKLVPALYNLEKEGHLSDHTVIVGFARRPLTDTAFRQQMHDAIDQFSRSKPVDPTFWDSFSGRLFYCPGEFDQDGSYESLKSLLTKIDQEFGTQGNRIYDLSTQPSYFPIIIEKLSKHHLIADPKNKSPWTRVMIEKPFGHDLASAQELEKGLSHYLDESQIYRIDHYLGKEGVQNILALRFYNTLFEPLWNAQYIDHVQITLSEDIGIGSRVNFWEETGTLRDVFQNHLMQLLALVAIEPPAQLTAEDIRSEKIKVLDAIRPISVEEIDQFFIRGQYGPGQIQGKEVVGYRQEKGAPEGSTIDTFTAAKLFIDNPRWKGVPFYIRGGKRLPAQTTQIVIAFKHHPNVLFIRVQPNPGVYLCILAKVPGLTNSFEPITFGYNLESYFVKPSPEAYEKLFYDSINGDSSLFVASEEQIAAWRLLTPILEHWKTHPPTSFPNYSAGTWGPVAADQLLKENGRQWQLLENNMQTKEC